MNLRAMIVVAGLVTAAGLSPLAPQANASERRGSAESADIDYVVTRVQGPAQDHYGVTLRFKGNDEGTTTLVLPGQWAGAEHAERGIEGLTVATPNARLEDTDKPEIKHIVHRPGEWLTVRYVLVRIGAGEPSVEDPSPYLPVLQPGYFEWIGWTTWVTPSKEDERLRVTVSFTNLPPTGTSRRASDSTRARSCSKDRWIASLVRSSSAETSAFDRALRWADRSSRQCEASGGSAMAPWPTASRPS